MSSAGSQDESAAEERARQLAIRLSPRQVVRVLGAVTALLVLIHALLSYIAVELRGLQVWVAPD